ncbi:MAG: hypothetical protein ACYCZN_15755 [Candidatus Dormibacteria bacterium]
MKFLAVAQRIHAIEEGGQRRFDGAGADLEADDWLRRAHFGLHGI